MTLYCVLNFKAGNVCGCDGSLGFLLLYQLEQMSGWENILTGLSKLKSALKSRDPVNGHLQV